MSVIIPTFCRPRMLARARAVASARAASSAGVEIVVVDDASKDEAAEVCRSLPGVKYVRLERNLGVAGARNVGLLATAGEYVAFLDDGRLPGSLDLQVAQLEENPEAGFCCGPLARNLWTALRLHPLATFRRVFTPDNARFVRKTLVRLLG